MQNPNGTILKLYHAGRLAAALRAFESLPSSPAAPAPLTAATYAALVAACSRLRSLPQGRRVHRHLVVSSSSSSSPDAHLARNTVLNNHLITMYGRCAAPDLARQVFDEMPAKNPVSWAAVIAAHVQNGRAGDALGLFSSMLRSGTAADQFALGSAVRACTELGDVGAGRQGSHSKVLKWRHYSLEYGEQIHSLSIKYQLDRDLYAGCSLSDIIMEPEYGIVPMREHCSCVIDLLARAGRLTEAEKFIDQMPFDPDIIMWKTLLAASRTHNDMDMGKRAAEDVNSPNMRKYVLQGGLDKSYMVGLLKELLM
ncbi:hypothetical protein E2562_012854 [Oryza meyeriana var. granulata]|uniref:Pentacotripeptide-repeat region of PRORP domain-containing protein n=1 Tax=Oryza meyeriana var. granulata TaxID=110450 RepID=A0A6G1CQX9_9ORYZ|nr:hypothetical protein E2562_012854 [Oryza meyeriana var. granulata]